MELITIAAIVIGPLFALMTSRLLDQSRSKYERRMDIFRTLMRTRRISMSPEHVGALNLIEIEFAGDEQVISSWKALFEHFGTNHTRSGAEIITPEMARDEVTKRNNAFDQRLFDERQRLLAKVLHAIAKRLGFKAEQLEIFEGGYTPQGWVDVETEQRLIRRFGVELFLGRARLPISLPDLPKAPDPPTT